MKAILAEPMREPQVVDIEDSLFAFQHLLGNHVDIADDFVEPIAIVFNEDSANKGIGNVFFFCDAHCNPRYMISGKILVVGLDGDYPCSLTKDQIERYERIFHSTVFYFTMQDEQAANVVQTVPPRIKKRKEEKRYERTGR